MEIKKIGEYALLSGLFVGNHLLAILRAANPLAKAAKREEVDETASTLVTSRGIAKSCDVFPNLIISDEKSFNPEWYRNIKDGDKVYVISKSLGGFVKEILPKLEEEKISITLVTGASVRGVPREISEQHQIDYLELIEKSDVITHWFTQNYDLDYVHEKITPIPLGLDYHTLYRKPFWWGTKAYPIDQEKQLLRIASRAKPFWDRLDKSYSFFHFNVFERHGGDRYEAMKWLEGKNFNVFAWGRMSRKRTWQICSKYKYIISPHGNGLDCHRTYEAIALGCIPVVRTSSLDLIYRDLPVIILQNWEECTIERLNEEAKKLKLEKIEKIRLGYWVNLIGSKSLVVS